MALTTGNRRGGGGVVERGYCSRGTHDGTWDIGVWAFSGFPAEGVRIGDPRYRVRGCRVHGCGVFGTTLAAR